MTDPTFHLDSALGFVLNRVSGLLKTALQRAFAEAGHNVTSEQWAVLCTLRTRNGSFQRELAEILGKDPANLTRILDGMERRHQITRESDPADRRTRRVHLTPEGEELLTSLIDIPRRLLETCVSGIDPDDVATVLRVVRTIESNLNAEEAS